MILQTSNRFNYKAFCSFFSEYWSLTIAFSLLAILSLINLLMTTWQEVDQAHGPLVLMVVIYLFYVKLSEPRFIDNPQPIVGLFLFTLALLAYVLGKSQDIVIIELLSFILLIASFILTFKGVGTLRLLWFPIFFMFFMVPLPGFIVGAITMPMKIAVSTVAEHILYWLNYPIARSGVILQIGQYQLLVADACAGMHTLISLEALGLLYLNLIKHDSITRNIVLAMFIVPISFAANTIRVIAITLITFYFGDEVGQGFVHGFAGMVLFLVALILIISVDTFIQSLIKK